MDGDDANYWGYVVGAAVVFGVVGYIGEQNCNTIVNTNIGSETRDAARSGKVTADHACAAYEGFSTNLNQYFAAKAEGGKVNPTLTITKADCMRLMAEKTAAPALGQ